MLFKDMKGNVKTLIWELKLIVSAEKTQEGLKVLFL